MELKAILNRDLCSNYNIKLFKKMKYKEVASKVFYILMVVMIFFILCFLTFLLYKSLHSKERAVFYIVIGLISIVMLQIFLFFGKFIYAKIDLERRVFIFGNLLMQNETLLNKVEYVGGVLAYSGAHKIKIEGKVHYYISMESNTAKNFDQLT